MTFTISLEHTKDDIWLAKRERQWEHLCLHGFSSDASDEELSPYKEYFFYGDVEAALSTGKIIDFRTILFWSPANSLSDMKKIFDYYWSWFFSYQDNKKIYQGNYYHFDSAEAYFNSILLDLAGWTSHQPSEVMSELFLWIFGESYENARVFPVSLGGEWRPRIKVDMHVLAIYLLRGVRGYLFSYKPEPNYEKYGLLISYLLSVFHLIEPRVYEFGRMRESEVKPELDHTDQQIMRWFVANLENVPTKREIKKNNGEIPHNDPEMEAVLRDGLKKVILPEDYDRLVEFVHNHGKNCLTFFEGDE